MTLAERFEALKSKAEKWPKWLRVALPWLGVAAVLLFFQGGALYAHMQRSANPHIFNDDARILIVPFDRYADPELFPNDRITDYYLQSLPDGYRLLFILAAKIGSAAALSKVLPYLLLALLAGALGATAHKLAGRAAAFGAVALCVGSEIFMSRMAGGLPRSFAFPLIAMAAAALVYGRVWLLAALVCLGAATYPVTAAIMGLTLGGMLVVLPASHRGEAEKWSLKKRAVFLAATAFTAALILAPTAYRLRGWGAQIKPAAFAEYPEAGPGGRFFPEDRPPFPAFFTAAPQVMRQTLVGAGEPWSEAGRKLVFPKKDDPRADWFLVGLLLVSAVGYGRLAWKSIEARRLFILLAAAFVGHGVAQLVTPSFFLPQRYVLYTVPILGLTVLCAGFVGLWPDKDEKKKKLAFIAVLAGNLLVLSLFGGRGGKTTGLNIAVGPEERALNETIGKLPKTALIAGWPSSVDSIPYETDRPILVSFETSMPFHTGFTEMMRARTNAVIDAYFATSLEPIQKLRDEFGVTHLLVRPSHLKGRAPGYFKPFDVRVREATSRAAGKGYELLRQQAKAAIFERGDWVLLDLSKL